MEQKFSSEILLLLIRIDVAAFVAPTVETLLGGLLVR